MGDAKNTSGYRQGGEGDDDGGQDLVGQNPTGRPRKSSARQRRKKDRKLFGGTPWLKKPKDGGK
jgi:hypothetical protein